MNGIQAHYLARKLAQDLNTSPDELGPQLISNKLDLGQNGLTSLPDFIGSLVSLKELYLDANNLTRLPDSLGQPADLEVLDVRGNKLDVHSRAILDKLERMRVNVRQ